jgi:hypothetical protein
LIIEGLFAAIEHEHDLVITLAASQSIGMGSGGLWFGELGVRGQLLVDLYAQESTRAIE